MAIVTDKLELNQVSINSTQWIAENIPNELKKHSFFIPWFPVPKELKSGAIKLLKKPDDPQWSKKKTNHTFDQCETTRGLGFRYTSDHPFICLDFDDDKGKTPFETLKEAALKFQSYTEVSPSGKGLHVILSVQDKESFKSNKLTLNGVEVFVSSGYVTLTGRTVGDTNTIRASSANEVYELLGYKAPFAAPEDFNDVDDYKNKSTERPVDGYTRLSATKVRELLRLVPVKALTGSSLTNLFGKAELLNELNGTEDYAAWIKIGQAIHHNFRGSLEGFAIWNEWSAEGDNYDAEVCGQKWESFRIKPHSITIGLLIKLAASQRPEFPDKGKRGGLMPTHGNLIAYLNFCRVELYFDEITKQSKIKMSARAAARWHLKSYPSELSLGEVAAFICTDLVSLGFPPSSFGESKLKKILTARSRLTPRNIIRDYFIECHKKWDGRDRLTSLYDTLLPKNRSFDFAYQQFLRKWLLQVVVAATQDSDTHTPARLNQMLILIGPQELGKSNWIQSLFPPGLRDFCAEKRLNFGGGFRTDGVKLAMELQGLLICSLNEVDVYFARQGSSELKIFLDATNDMVVLPYGEAPVKMVRRTVFAGSANEPNFLRDITGNRRYLCIWLQDLKHKHNIDVDMLWGQMYSIMMTGEPHWFNPEDPKDKKVIAIRDAINSGLMHMPNEAIQEALYYNFDVERAQLEECWERLKLSRIFDLLGLKAPVNSKEYNEAKKTVQAWSIQVSGKHPQMLAGVRAQILYFMPPLREEPAKELMSEEDAPPTIEEQIKQLEARLAQLKSKQAGDEFN